MRTIKECLITPVKYSCDVLVAGGGVAGIAAAVAAAREGASVTLIERSFALGGLATSGLVTIYLPLCDGMGRQVSFGLAEELLHLSVEHGAEGDNPKHLYPDIWVEEHTAKERRDSGKRFDVQFNPHFFAISAEKLLRSLGVKILFGTTATAVSERGDRIDSVIIESKSGREAIEVKKCVIDATGDADLTALSSAKTTLYSKGNILAAWYYYTDETSGSILRPLGASRLSEGMNTEIINKRYTGIDTEEISDMMGDSHALIEEEILLRRSEGKNISPTCMASIPQLRMTRRMVGLYTLDDSEMHKRFEDSIGMVSDWRKRGPVYEIPFGTLRAKEVKNLLTSGRCISVTDEMWDITRVIPDCAVTGEAAGIAASMTDDLDTLSVTALQEKLRARGIILHEDELSAVPD